VVAVDGAEAHTGSHSLKVTGKGGYCNHVFAASSGPVAAAGPVLNVRFWLKLASALGPEHVTLLAMKDPNDGGKDLRMGGQAEILMFNRESDDATLPALSPAGIALSVRPAPSSWHCVEIQVDGAAGLLRTWVDEVEVTALQIDGTSTPDVDEQWLRRGTWRPSPSDLRLGWESYGSASMTLWFDDVAVGPTRIGCR